MMAKLISCLFYLYDIYFPRFMEEEIAIKYLDDNSAIFVNLKDQLTDQDDYDAIVTVKFFNLFGIAIFTRTKTDN